MADVALDRALKECEESLRLLPDLAGTLDSRGTVLLRLGRLDEAIRDFDQALKHSPHQINSLYLRAVARSKKGDYAGARADLALVRETSPTLIERMERNGFVVLQSAGATNQNAVEPTISSGISRRTTPNDRNGALTGTKVQFGTRSKADRL